MDTLSMEATLVKTVSASPGNIFFLFTINPPSKGLGLWESKTRSQNSCLPWTKWQKIYHRYQISLKQYEHFLTFRAQLFKTNNVTSYVKLWLLNLAYTLIFLLKNVSSVCICKSYSHFFSKNTCELDIVLTRTSYHFLPLTSSLN